MVVFNPYTCINKSTNILCSIVKSGVLSSCRQHHARITHHKTAMKTAMYLYCLGRWVACVDTNAAIAHFQRFEPKFFAYM